MNLQFRELTTCVTPSPKVYFFGIRDFTQLRSKSLDPVSKTLILTSKRSWTTKIALRVPGGSRYRTNTPTLGLDLLIRYFWHQQLMSTARGAATSDSVAPGGSLVAAPRAVLIGCWCHKYLKSNSRPNVGVFVRYLLPPGTSEVIFLTIAPHPHRKWSVKPGIFEHVCIVFEKLDLRSDVGARGLWTLQMSNKHPLIWFR